MSASDDKSQSAASPRRDEWYNEPKSSESLHLNGGKLIGDDRVFEVRSDHEAEAEQMLDSASIAELNQESAQRMVGDRFHDIAGFIPFLARGLYYSKETGRWRVYELGGKLQVAYFCLGNKPMDMHRQVVVLLLKAKPTKVYTFCGSTQ